MAEFSGLPLPYFRPVPQFTQTQIWAPISAIPEQGGQSFFWPFETNKRLEQFPQMSGRTTSAFMGTRWPSISILSSGVIAQTGAVHELAGRQMAFDAGLTDEGLLAADVAELAERFHVQLHTSVTGVDIDTDFGMPRPSELRPALAC